jgi:hypothetical protein
MLARADLVTAGLHPSEKAVLTRLCIDADSRGGDVSRLSAADLCRLTGFSWRAVTMARSRLAELGHILVCGAPGERADTIVDPRPTISAPSALKSNSEKLSTAQRTRVMERDAYRCRYCGGHEQLSIDHIVPRSAGGSSDDDNLQVLCVPCNARKGAKQA